MNYKNDVKRLLDIILALLCVPFCLMIFFVVAPLIYFTDSGSVFYCSYRIGQKGIPFKMYKFRTMYVNAPDIRLEDGSTYNAEDDPRVTKVGRFLRKTSIDELPQILNVLLGNMSFIGPRPDTIDWLSRYSEEQRFFLNVKPGISGYSQAYFRNSVDAVVKQKNDLFYAKNISFVFDFKIFLKTIRTIFFRENLYISKK